MIDIFSLKVWSPIFEMSTPSILMNELSFFWISKILNIVFKIEDFPDPVLPTHPIFSFCNILKVRFFKIKGDWILYLKLTFSNSNSPS